MLQRFFLSISKIIPLSNSHTDHIMIQKTRYYWWKCVETVWEIDVIHCLKMFNNY